MQRAWLLTLALIAPPAGAQDQGVPPSRYEQAIQRQNARVELEIAPANKRVPFHASWESLSGYRPPEWFRDAKFGIFVHWGVYAVPAFGNEWYSRNMYIEGNAAHAYHVRTYGPLNRFGYKDFIPLFRAEHFDPDQWASLFAQAGARYVVPVAEHCDGFAMYASAMTPWTAAVMGPKRDVAGELAAAVRRQGMRLGLSMHTAEHWWWFGVGNATDTDVRHRDERTARLYGPAEAMQLPVADEPTAWTREPDPSHLERWLPPDKAFTALWLAQTTEIVDLYHPDLVYFDWWTGQPAMKPALQAFAAYYYDRSVESGVLPVLTYKEESMPPDTGTLDIERGKLDTLRLLPWQTDTSISIHSWGYVDHDEYRTASSLIQQLVDTVAKNGNLLLNIGPKADGTLPEPALTVLQGMGAWLRANGEAIYGTRPFSVYGEGPTVAPRNSTEKNHDIQAYTATDIRYTQSKDGETVYAILLGWPDRNVAVLHTLFSDTPYLAKPICSVDLLGSGAAVSLSRDRYGLHVLLPAGARSSLPDIAAYALRLRTRCGPG